MTSPPRGRTPRTGDYAEASIRVLKGLEPVRQRPGMYTRTDSPLHIVQEVIDNAADEFLSGFGKKIEVTLHKDGAVTVEDDGRGIPVGLHPEEGVPVVEIVFTRLHAGGKFDKRAGGAYAFSGGLHGVGVSVTNALAQRMDVTVWREGAEHTIGFAGGDVRTKLASEPGAGRRSGTRITVWPDPKYFDTPNVPVDELERLLRSKAVLLPGTEVRFVNEKTGVERRWRFDGGLKEYLLQSLAAEPAVPPFEASAFASADDASFAEGEGADCVLVWTEEGAPTRESYVNLIPTPAGGTHEAGLREAMFTALRAFIDAHNLLPKGVKLLPEDVFARASFVLSAKALDPQFQGQVKERLNSRDALRLVAGLVRPQLEFWLNQHPEHGRKLAEMAIAQAQARARAGQRVEKKKGSAVAVLPGKLTDCESTDVARNEIFLVEGDSAGGSAKMGRDKEFQAVLPLRGKVLNTWEVERDRLFANAEVHDIAVALGIDPHGPDDAIDWASLRYGKVCILADADVDGSHIQVLLLTLFFRHFPQLVTRGHVCVARPPLFRVDVPAAGKRPARRLYCLDDDELQATLEKLADEGVRESAWSIARFKGLGEMSPEQLWETTLNPDTRRLLPVTLGELAAAETAATMTMLMGRGEAAQRRAWLEERGNEVEVDV
ncbi:MAG: type IIA DNA topoisomerase subunit B [Burkholderiales bacterium]|jgi:topoisomerase-4 subunit B|nr:type IIA DNA topoisomerase subunit B [Burkholderiales bacterium]